MSKKLTEAGARCKAAVQRMAAVAGNKDAVKAARRSRVDVRANNELARQKAVAEENKTYYQGMGRQWHTPRGFSKAAKG